MEPSVDHFIPHRHRPLSKQGQERRGSARRLRRGGSYAAPALAAARRELRGGGGAAWGSEGRATRCRLGMYPSSDSGWAEGARQPAGQRGSPVNASTSSRRSNSGAHGLLLPFPSPSPSICSAMAPPSPYFSLLLNRSKRL